MKLLIITQKVDRNDPILGFFHRWVEEFAKHCESIIVICLYKGEYTLPQNVRVLSLGKESGEFRLKYLYRFYKYIWQERKNYDAVFVHMNQEYIVLGALFWKILRKKITLWRNHQSGSMITRLAVYCSDKVFCTSRYSFTARFKKTIIMSVGIDTDLFKRNETIVRIPQSVLFLGRISPIKNVDVFIDALNLLDQKNIDFIANIYGSPLEIHDGYYNKIKAQARTMEENGKIIFHGAIPNYETPKIYNQHEIFVNLTASGSFDKTILEAMACESLVVVSNQSLASMLPETFLFNDRDALGLSKKLETILVLTKNEKEKYGKILRQQAIPHDLSTLAKSIVFSVK